MTRAAAIRRLALDINPWVWAYIVTQTLILVALDTLWLLGGNNIPPSLQFSILIYMSANFTTQKAPLWRILPVSRIEIDRARWWQGMAAPALLLWLIGCGMALLLEALGRLKVAWPYIASGVLAQSAVGSLFIGAIMVGFAFAAQKVGRWSAIMMVLLALAIYALTPLQYMWPGLRDILPVLDVLGLATAVGLYVLAGRWPAPLTANLWNLPAATSSNKIAASAPTLRGWPVLISRSLPNFVLLWMATVATALGMKFAFNGRVQWLALMMASVVVQWAIAGLATALRALRLLPLTAWQLTARLSLMLLAVQAVAAACFCAVVTISGEPVAPGSVAAILVFPLLFFPFLLHFPRMLQMGTAAWIIFALLSQILGSAIPLLISPTPAGMAAMIVAPVLLTPLVMAVGVLWMRREITHGRSAYQVKPALPSRWRGWS